MVENKENHHKKQPKREKGASLRAMTFTAAAAAMSVMLCRFLGFSPQDSPVRFDFGFFPLAIVGQAFGAAYAGVGYLVADIIGSLVQGYAPNIWISGCKLLTGFIMGAAFGGRRHVSLPRVVIAFTLINVLIDFLLMTPIFVFMYRIELGAALYTRGLNAAVTLPVRIITFYILARALERPLAHIGGRK